MQSGFMASEIVKQYKFYGAGRAALLFKAIDFGNK